MEYQTNSAKRCQLIFELLACLVILLVAAAGCSQASRDLYGCLVVTNAKEAINYCTGAIESGQIPSGGLAKAFNKRGFEYRSLGDNDRAILDYDRAIQLDPEMAIAYNNRGLAYHGKGADVRAIQDYDASIRLDSSDAKVFNNRGLSYYSMGNNDRAIQDYDRAIQLRPGLGVSYNNRGLTYHAQGDEDRAIQDYNQAIHLSPELAVAYNNRGLIYQIRGKYDLALEDYNHAIQLSPNDAKFFNNRGLTYHSKGEDDRAIQDYSQAIQLNPRLAIAFDNRAFSYWSKGKVSLALQDLDQPIRINPDDMTGYEKRAIFLFFSGDLVASKRDFTEVHSHLRNDLYPVIWLYIIDARDRGNAGIELARNTAGLNLKQWPGPAVQLYLHRTSPEELLSLTKDTRTDKQSAMQTEAYFYLGELALMGNDRTKAAAWFQKSVELGVHTDFGFDAAAAELKRLQETRPGV